jgi:hypothetical protein
VNAAAPTITATTMAIRVNAIESNRAPDDRFCGVSDMELSIKKVIRAKTKS